MQDLNNASSTHSSLPPATMQVSRDSVEMDSANPTEDNHELDDESSVSGANGGSDNLIACIRCLCLVFNIVLT